MSRIGSRVVTVTVWPDGVFVERDGVTEHVDYVAKEEQGRAVLNVSGRLTPQELAEAAVEGCSQLWRLQWRRTLAAMGGKRFRAVPITGKANARGG
jgi:hypothetical protein